jgi:4-hydroxybenzoate polyprenyltransferase
MRNPTEAVPITVPVLCVDLDGTLIMTDTLAETLFAFVRHHPLLIPLIPFWLLRGRFHLKMKLAERVPFSAATLPYNEELLSHLHERRSAGVRIVLATGANRLIANRVADHLGLFDEVLASDDTRNLTGRTKAKLLAEKYPAFEYVADSWKDVPVWLHSKSAIVVSPSSKILTHLGRHSIPARSMAGKPKSGISVWLRVTRVHQWVKNLLIFLPMLTSHRLLEWPTFGFAAVGFLSFSLCASGTYLINDLLDVQADRSHPRKRRRPFAAGLLNPVSGMLAALALLAAGLGIATALPMQALLLLAAYVGLTLCYSLVFKRFLSADVILLVGFYLLRILFGGVATGIVISVWLLAFSMFFFLTLALIKRLTELRAIEQLSDSAARVSARGYQAADTSVVASLSGSSAYLSVGMLALYINSPEAHGLYLRQEFLWPVCLIIIYWLNRMLLIANRGRLHDDPIIFAFRDRASWVAAAIFALCLYAAQ